MNKTSFGKGLTAVVVGVAFAGWAGVALAHGELKSTRPKADSTVELPPQEISVTLTEAPSPGAVMRAKDGCGKQVVATVSVAEATVTGDVTNGAQPGQWTVSWRAISAVDGHETEGKFSFLVNGITDCSAGAGGSTPTPEPTVSEASSPAAAPTDTPEVAPSPTESDVDLDAAPASKDDGGGFPTVPVAIGAGVIIAVAVVARVAGAR
jgi:copper resistance protein C